MPVTYMNHLLLTLHIGNLIAFLLLIFLFPLKNQKISFVNLLASFSISFCFIYLIALNYFSILDFIIGFSSQEDYTSNLKSFFFMGVVSVLIPSACLKYLIYRKINPQNNMDPAFRSRDDKRQQIVVQNELGELKVKKF